MGASRLVAPGHICSCRACRCGVYPGGLYGHFHDGPVVAVYYGPGRMSMEETLAVPNWLSGAITLCQEKVLAPNPCSSTKTGCPCPITES